jgi:hypothetical protein
MGMLTTSNGEGEGRICQGMRGASQLAKIPAAWSTRDHPPPPPTILWGFSFYSKSTRVVRVPGQLKRVRVAGGAKQSDLCGPLCVHVPCVTFKSRRGQRRLNYPFFGSLAAVRVADNQETVTYITCRSLWTMTRSPQFC